MSLFSRNRENKRLHFFVLSKKDVPDKFLCIALSKDNIIEYAQSLIKFEHQSHFESWCAVRNYDLKDLKAWQEYYTDCITFEEKSEYRIVNVSYRLRDIAAIMRIFGNCAPIGCSFETPIEHEHARVKNELLACQIKFEEYWKENHQEEAEETIDGSESR